MVLSSADIFFQNQFFFFFFFYFYFGNIRRVSNSWVQIMPVGSDLDLNCLQRLSADDTSK